MKRAIRLFLAGLAMLAVAVLGGAIALRLAIHGREVAVPNLEGKSDAEAAALAKDLGLSLSVENRFYSAAVTPNHVLSQSPVAGSRVRRGWLVRVTESLGGQKIEVPNVMGQGERAASLVLRRQQLEQGTIVHLPAPGPSGMVLAQSPPPNSVGLNGPKVALLVSDDESAGAQTAYIMPSLTGLTLSAAGSRLSTAGLHIASAQQPQVVETPTDTPPTDPAGGEVPAPAIVVPVPVSPNALIVSQSPAPGHKVTRADSIRVTLAN